MKKLYILAIALLCGVLNVLAANDLIIKTNSEKIEALIQEVGATEVRYKKASNPNGPVYVIKSADISTIIYANGEVQVMAASAAPKPVQPQPQPQQVQPQPQPQQVQQSQQVRTQPQQPQPKQVQPASYFAVERMRKEGKTYYLDNKPMTRAEMLEFMQQNCDQAYQQYLKGRKLENAGWALFGVGAGFAVGSAAMNIVMHAIPRQIYASNGYSYSLQKNPAYDALNMASITTAAIGGCFLLAGIPVLCVGAVKKNNIHKTYNTWCAGTDKTASLYEFNLTSGANGLGIAMSF